MLRLKPHTLEVPSYLYLNLFEERNPKQYRFSSLLKQLSRKLFLRGQNTETDIIIFQAEVSIMVQVALVLLPRHFGVPFAS